MLLHSIHILTNLALKEAVPPQPRTSPHVTVKICIQYSELRALSVFQGKRKFLKNPECKKYIQYEKNLRASDSWSKILNGKKYIQYSEKFYGKLFFRASASCSKILNSENIFNTVYSGYIHLEVIRVIWASVVCNLDQNHDWL